MCCGGHKDVPSADGFSNTFSDMCPGHPLSTRIAQESSLSPPQPGSLPGLLSFMLAHAHLLLVLALKAGLNVGLRGLCQLAAGKDRDLGHETGFGGCPGQAGNSFMACSVCQPVSCLPGSGDHPASISVLFLWLYLLVSLLKRVLLLNSITGQMANVQICHTIPCHVPHLTP